MILHNIHDPDQDSEKKTKEVKFVSSSKGQGKDEIIVIQEGSFVLAASSDCYIFYCFLPVPHCILKGIAISFYEDPRQQLRT